MRIIVTDNYEEMSRKAASIVRSQIILKPDCVLGLATGSTPAGMYRELVAMYERHEIDFSEVTVFNLDEYCKLGSGSKQSYHYYMHHHFFKYVNFRKENIFIPNCASEDILEECANYDAEINIRGGIDLQILGIGIHGHIGFNEPGPDFEAETHLVHLAEQTIEANARFFDSGERVPDTAISMGIRTIMQAKMLVLLASGEEKSEAIRKAVRGKISPEVPASILQIHPNAMLVLDREAARML